MKIKLSESDFAKIVKGTQHEQKSTAPIKTSENPKPELKIWLAVENVRMRQEAEERGTTTKDFLNIYNKNKTKEPDAPNEISQLLGAISWLLSNPVFTKLFESNSKTL